LASLRSLALPPPSPPVPASSPASLSLGGPPPRALSPGVSLSLRLAFPASPCCSLGPLPPSVFPVPLCLFAPPPPLCPRRRSPPGPPARFAPPSPPSSSFSPRLCPPGRVSVPASAPSLFRARSFGRCVVPPSFAASAFPGPRPAVSLPSPFCGVSLRVSFGPFPRRSVPPASPVLLPPLAPSPLSFLSRVPFRPPRLPSFRLRLGSGCFLPRPLLLRFPSSPAFLLFCSPAGPFGGPRSSLVRFVFRPSPPFAARFARPPRSALPSAFPLPSPSSGLVPPLSGLCPCALPPPFPALPSGRCCPLRLPLRFLSFRPRVCPPRLAPLSPSLVRVSRRVASPLSPAPSPARGPPRSLPLPPAPPLSPGGRFAAAASPGRGAPPSPPRPPRLSRPRPSLPSSLSFRPPVAGPPALPAPCGCPSPSAPGFPRFPFAPFPSSFPLFSPFFSSFPPGPCSLSVSRPSFAFAALSLPFARLLPCPPLRRRPPPAVASAPSGALPLSGAAFPPPWSAAPSASASCPSLRLGPSALFPLRFSRFPRRSSGPPCWFLFLRFLLCFRSAGRLVCFAPPLSGVPRLLLALPPSLGPAGASPPPLAWPVPVRAVSSRFPSRPRSAGLGCLLFGFLLSFAPRSVPASARGPSSSPSVSPRASVLVRAAPSRPGAPLAVFRPLPAASSRVVPGPAPPSPFLPALRSGSCALPGSPPALPPASPRVPSAFPASLLPSSALPLLLAFAPFFLAACARAPLSPVVFGFSPPPPPCPVLAAGFSFVFCLARAPLSPGLPPAARCPLFAFPSPPLVRPSCFFGRPPSVARGSFRARALVVPGLPLGLVFRPVSPRSPAPRSPSRRSSPPFPPVFLPSSPPAPPASPVCSFSPPPSPSFPPPPFAPLPAPPSRPSPLPLPPLRLFFAASSLPPALSPVFPSLRPPPSPAPRPRPVRPPLPLASSLGFPALPPASLLASRSAAPPGRLPGPAPPPALPRRPAVLPGPSARSPLRAAPVPGVRVPLFSGLPCLPFAFFAASPPAPLPSGPWGSLRRLRPAPPPVPLRFPCSAFSFLSLPPFAPLLPPLRPCGPPSSLRRSPSALPSVVAPGGVSPGRAVLPARCCLALPRPSSFLSAPSPALPPAPVSPASPGLPAPVPSLLPPSLSRACGPALSGPPRPVLASPSSPSASAVSLRRCPPPVRPLFRRLRSRSFSAFPAPSLPPPPGPAPPPRLPPALSLCPPSSVWPGAFPRVASLPPPAPLLVVPFRPFLSVSALRPSSPRSPRLCFLLRCRACPASPPAPSSASFPVRPPPVSAPLRSPAFRSCFLPPPWPLLSPPFVFPPPRLSPLPLPPPAPPLPLPPSFGPRPPPPPPSSSLLPCSCLPASACFPPLLFSPSSPRFPSPPARPARSPPVPPRPPVPALPRARPPGPASPPRSFPAPPFLSALGAGLPAAAGPRLALPLFLVPRFPLFSFPFPAPALACSFLSLPPCLRLGSFARLLPSFAVVAVSPAPSPASPPPSPFPVPAWSASLLPSPLARAALCLPLAAVPSCASPRSSASPRPVAGLVFSLLLPPFPPSGFSLPVFALAFPRLSRRPVLSLPLPAFLRPSPFPPSPAFLLRPAWLPLCAPPLPPGRLPRSLPFAAPPPAPRCCLRSSSSAFPSSAPPPPPSPRRPPLRLLRSFLRSGPPRLVLVPSLVRRRFPLLFFSPFARLPRPSARPPARPPPPSFVPPRPPPAAPPRRPLPSSPSSPPALPSLAAPSVFLGPPLPPRPGRLPFSAPFFPRSPPPPSAPRPPSAAPAPPFSPAAFFCRLAFSRSRPLGLRRRPSRPSPAPPPPGSRAFLPRGSPRPFPRLPGLPVCVLRPSSPPFGFGFVRPWVVPPFAGPPRPLPSLALVPVSVFPRFPPRPPPLSRPPRFCPRPSGGVPFPLLRALGGFAPSLLLARPALSLSLSPLGLLPWPSPPVPPFLASPSSCRWCRLRSRLPCSLAGPALSFASPPPSSRFSPPFGSGLRGFAAPRSPSPRFPGPRARPFPRLLPGWVRPFRLGASSLVPRFLPPVLPSRRPRAASSALSAPCCFFLPSA
ncbi:hypothetical protein BCR33DRAFT_831939, partial [Rhizoclosmatium globosum]